MGEDLSKRNGNQGSSGRQAVFLLTCLSVLVGVVPADAADDDAAFFESRIRPVLVKHCYECHSAASSEVGGELLLDFRDGLIRGGESGPAIVPGQPQESLLVAALRYQSLEMPPTGPLPEHVVADVEHWIRTGAFDPRDQPPSAAEASAASWKAQLAERSQWWSLQPPKLVTPPTVDNLRWSRDPVDRFILAALEQAELHPAESASSEVLLRRLSFVLTGLPPQPARVHSFETAFQLDPDRAVEQLVDQLLQSPHYGERFARHWMDVVRYTDTYGYEWDIPARGSWEYRDYLIRAFNDDVGYDQLLREHIAGDLLKNPRINQTMQINESMVGPMFYHMGEHRHGSSLDFNGIHQEMINNKIDAFSKAFLGMTVACARCHDHKLDAISQADYYALAGVFMTPRWTARSIDTPTRHAAEIEELKELRSQISQQIAQVWIQSPGPLASGTALRQWAAEHRSLISGATLGDVAFPFSKLLHDTNWLPITGLSAVAESEQTRLEIEADGATVLASGDVPPTDSYQVHFQTAPGSVSVLRLEALTHDSLGSLGPGRTPHGNFVLSQIRVEVQPLVQKGDEPKVARLVELRSARADYSQPNYPVTAALNTSTNGWGVGLGGNVDRTAWFTFAEPVELDNGGQWTITLDQRLGSGHVLGRFRITPGTDFLPAPLHADGSVRPSDVADQAASESWQQLATEWRNAHQQRLNANASAFTVLTDFQNDGFPEGWVTEGAGVEHGWVADGTPLISLEGETLIAEFLPRGIHTHALSSKLPGAIRLPAPDQFPGSKVSVQLSGGEWSGWRSIPQNAFLSEGPAFLDPTAAPAWKTFAAAPLKNGVTRLLTEITTSSLNSNFPPRTGVARAGTVTLPDSDEGFDKRSWFSITGIVAHEAGGVPAETLKMFVPLYKSEPPAGADGTWQRLADWLNGSVQRWAGGTATSGDVKLLNWTLASGLLPNDFSSIPQAAELVRHYRDVESRIAFSRTANSMDERGTQPMNYRLNIRGNVDEEGPAVPRGFLEVFAGHHGVDSTSGSGRLQLADYLSSPENPQTARVFVNRVWHWIFGTGLVATPNDFGKLGDRPSHPELLDWLTIQFMNEGWSVKKLVRRLMLSETFRQSGTANPGGAAVSPASHAEPARADSIFSQRDPDNRLLHHYPTRRLEAEAIRDSLLAVSGRLDPQLYGRPINPPRNTEDSAKRLFSGPLDSDGRRSLYLEMSIMDPPKFLMGFNLPDLKLPTGRRDVTNGPSQALILLNDQLVLQLAEYWGEHVVNDDSGSCKHRVQRMFVRALGRWPDEGEVKRWTNAVQRMAQTENVMTDQQAWSELAHLFFNTKEFIYYR